MKLSLQLGTALMQYCRLQCHSWWRNYSRVSSLGRIRDYAMVVKSKYMFGIYNIYGIWNSRRSSFFVILCPSPNCGIFCQGRVFVCFCSALAGLTWFADASRILGADLEERKQAKRQLQGGGAGLSWQTRSCKVTKTYGIPYRIPRVARGVDNIDY